MHNKADISAIFCANDTTALGVIHALKEKIFEYRKIISVISVDDIETAQYLSPMLTTVHIPLEELGRITAKTLIDRINGGHAFPCVSLFHFTLPKETVAENLTEDVRLLQVFLLSNRKDSRSTSSCRESFL